VEALLVESKEDPLLKPLVPPYRGSEEPKFVDLTEDPIAMPLQVLQSRKLEVLEEDIDLLVTQQPPGWGKCVWTKIGN
jgi:hypothetical protein